MPGMVDSIHDALINDPDFKPREGRTKDESAWAIAWSKYNQVKKNEDVLAMEPKEEQKQIPTDLNEGETPETEAERLARDEALNDLSKSIDILLSLTMKKEQSTPPYPGTIFDRLAHRWKKPEYAASKPIGIYPSPVSRYRAIQEQAGEQHKQLMHQLGQMYRNPENYSPEQIEETKQKISQLENLTSTAQRAMGQFYHRGIEAMQKQGLKKRLLTPPRPGLRWSEAKHHWIKIEKPKIIKPKQLKTSRDVIDFMHQQKAKVINIKEGPEELHYWVRPDGGVYKITPGPSFFSVRFLRFGAAPASVREAIAHSRGIFRPGA